MHGSHITFPDEDLEQLTSGKSVTSLCLPLFGTSLQWKIRTGQQVGELNVPIGNARLGLMPKEPTVARSCAISILAGT